MDNNNKTVIENIKDKYDELFNAEKKVASYVLDNMNEVVMLNVSELAQKSGASEATVVRACKHLGYEGYYQMRLLISRDVGQKKTVFDESEAMDTSEKLFDFSAERVRYLSEIIKYEDLLKASNLIMNSSRVHIVGVGNTVPIGMDLGFRLERYGIPSSYSMIAEHFFNHIALGSSSDVVIAISRTGASKQVIRAVELAKRKKMKVIVITEEMNEALVSNADCLIHIAEKNRNSTILLKPDSHLLEIAVNDAILRIIREQKSVTEKELANEEDAGDIGLLLSEYKI